VTNLDGLDTLESIKVCTHYKLGRKLLEVPPSDARQLADCRPVYTELPGWRTSTSDARSFRALPANARAYAQKIAELTGSRLSIVSVGPSRAQTISL
jgi:adenylosuccinate synthase